MPTHAHQRWVDDEIMWSIDHVKRVILSMTRPHLTESVTIGCNNHQGWLFKPSREAQRSVNEPFSGIVLMCGDSSEDAVDLGKKMSALASTISGRGFLTLLLEPRDPWDSAIADLIASVALLGGRGARRVAAVGFCVATCAVLDVVTQDGLLDAAVAAFPSTIPSYLSQGRNVRVPILSIFDVIEGLALSEAMSLACSQACQVVWRVAKVEQWQCGKVSKTTFMCSKQVIQEILSWLTIHLGVTTGDWNMERLAKRLPREDDCQYMVDNGGVPTFCNVGLMHLKQARARWRFKRYPRHPHRSDNMYETVLSTFLSHYNSSVPACRIRLDDVVALLVDQWTDI